MPIGVKSAMHVPLRLQLHEYSAHTLDWHAGCVVPNKEQHDLHWTRLQERCAMPRSRPNRTMDDFMLADFQDDSWLRQRAEKSTKNGAKPTVGCSGEAVDQGHAMSTAAKEELAHDLGYLNARQMMEQTEIVPTSSGAYTHLTTDSDGYWVAWNDKPFYDVRRFVSRQSALKALREDLEALIFES
jgi:hypothetical protein